MVTRELQQTPEPGGHVLCHCGDTLTFTLVLPREQTGEAWLRTNLGNNPARLDEIIAQVERNVPLRASDWHDILMRKTGPRRYTVTVPLLETGRFQGKAFFMPKDTHEPQWPEGGNVTVKVEPAEFCCGHTIYAAFVRQFGPNKFARAVPAEYRKSEQVLTEAGYAVIPPSGTFRDLVRELDFIIGKLRCRIIQLLPIHPVPTTYARMGRFGSPFAALDFKDVDPSLAEFDRKTTPLDQFRELCDAVHERGASLFIDIPINHTGWASHLQIEHPEWFARGKDRAFESPGAWGVTWEDLSRLDYAHTDLWRYMADVFLFWCRQGVDGFRCDAGYMIPLPVWEYIVARVRREYPSTIFLLEGLGGKLEVVESLLSVANIDWAYSELFQTYDRGQMEWYLPGCLATSHHKGVLVHFAETHDNTRLAARSHTYARMRTALSALFSSTGGFGITNGLEWFAQERVEVHGAPSLRWGSEENQVDLIARLNAVLEANPCFHPGAVARMIQRTGGNAVALLRTDAVDGESVLILANLDDRQSNSITWDPADFPVPSPGGVTDLVSARRLDIWTEGSRIGCSLEPGQVVCLTPRESDLRAVEAVQRDPLPVPERVHVQRLRSKALEVYRYRHGYGDITGVDVDALTQELAEDPRACCRKAGRGGFAGYAPVVAWQWPRDTRRTVMIPPGHFLYITAPHAFTAELREERGAVHVERSLRQRDGTHFVLILPLDAVDSPRHCRLHLSVYEPGHCRHMDVPVLRLSDWEHATVRMAGDRTAVARDDLYALCTNGRGAMAQVRGGWGTVRSQYDAILAANLHPDFPVDRRILFTRCRAWLVYRGYSQEVNLNCTEQFEVLEDGSVRWRFRMLAGHNKIIPIDIRLAMIEGRNAVALEFTRGRGENGTGMSDAEPVTLILRPDVEDRNNHEKTKAYLGAETAFRDAVRSRKDGFVFAPSADHRLEMRVHPGVFTSEPAWVYLVEHPEESARGLDGSSDLFSPGYFTLALTGGGRAVLFAEVLRTGETAGAEPDFEPVRSAPVRRLDAVTRAALRSFVVKRDNHKTVIAGYPWFLDWGRDTLICLRGMVAADMTDASRDILLQFAQFESNGTLPNMIRGKDDSNRDTSDAPLWFVVACADFLHRHGDELLDARCGKRVLRDVLRSIVEGYRQGTPNGIRMDPDSGLVFSPSHFTWMDTNYPAATPREGYPIEIQALWHAAVSLMGRIDNNGPWRDLARKVRESILQFYVHREGNAAWLSDCLHAGPGTPALRAVADDALRPNQLLAITLKAVHERSLCASVVSACEELVIPGAVRSLADRPVTRPIPVQWKGVMLNDPHHPYWGIYAGDEDTQRKPAYHNGTAWTWLFPSYCEALVMTYGEPARAMAVSLLSSSAEILNRGCVGQVAELADGDSPHILKGCGAQAWGVTELDRVLAFLTGKA